MSNLIDEIWKTSNVSDMYMVSNMGNVKSISRKVRSGPGDGYRYVSEKILKPFYSKSTGYLQVCIHKKKYSVHRLVAMSFLIEGYKQELVVNHINSKRDDNRLCNLEWVTHSENIKHSYDSNNVVSPTKGKFGKYSTRGTPVKATCIKTGNVLKFDSAMDAVRTGLFQSSSISRSCHGKIKHHAGYKWSFVDE